MNKSTRSNIIFERDTIFLSKCHYNRTNDVTQVGKGQYVTSHIFLVFCICGPSMTFQFSPLMTAGNCRCETVARLAFLLLWPAANWLGYLWFEHFLASDVLVRPESGARPIITTKFWVESRGR